MFFDWIARDGGAILSWWLLTMLAAVAIFPLFFRLMGALPSRGYALACAAGLMLIGFVFWIMNILGLIDNSPGATLLAAIIVLVAGIISYVTWNEREPILPWLRDHWSLILATDGLFTVLFLAWVIVRALNPSLVATEKPMEMAFLSAIRRSATFPPHDPWMSGYAISYYHFGYIIMGMLGNLSGVSNGVAFNLALPLLFALTGTGAFGIAYDLVVSHLQIRDPDLVKSKRDDNSAKISSPGSPSPFAERGSGGEVIPTRHYPQALGIGLLAAVFAVIMGNLGTALVEIPYQTCTASPAYLRFMNLEERDAYPAAQTPDQPCSTANTADPTHWNYWWWFRYSRVVRDLNLNGSPIGVQPITEMPIFSFVLSDMHPHVLALPFAMLAIALGLNLALRKRGLQPWEIFLYAIFVGGMVFLNSWDAVYLGLIIGAEALRRLIVNGTGTLTRTDLFGLGRFAVALVFLTGILYLPFFISFRSQAGGIFPNVIWPTQWQQFLLMFGPFVVIIGVYLFVEMRRAGVSFNWNLASQTMLTVIGLIVIAFVALAISAWLREDVRQAAFQVIDESGGLVAQIMPVLLRRLTGIPVEALLLLAIYFVIGRLFSSEPQTAEGSPAPARRVLTYSPATGYVLLLIAAGAVLTLAPDFVYLHDNFGVRINTVFKLYYQGWLLWSVAGAFALWSVLSKPADEPERGISQPARIAFGTVSVILIGLCLIYPVFAIYSRAIVEAGRGAGQQAALTLEGGPSLAASDDDYKAIQCLASVAKSDSDVVAEAIKAHVAYDWAYGRVSGLTGIPTLIGWDNHEMQWRGSTFDAANTYVDPVKNFTETRADAIAKLYNSANLSDAADVIKRYGITYVYVGPTERRDFSAKGIAKFDGLTPVCSSGDVDVYSADSILTPTTTTAGG